MNRILLSTLLLTLIASNLQGQFSEPKTLDACLPCAPVDTQAADLDQDGDNDLLFVGSITGDVAWSQNDGNGNFTPPALLMQRLPGVNGIFPADFNQDGLPDLVFGSANIQVGMHWALNEGDATFSEPMPIGSSPITAVDVEAADMDGDGWPDLIAAQSREVFWFRNEEGQGFSEKQLIADGLFQNTGLRLGDIDGDGDIDIFVPSDNAFRSSRTWFRNDGNGNFELEIFPDSSTGGSFLPPVRSWDLGDLDNDGDLDLVAVTYIQGGLFWSSNEGDGNFSFPILITGGIPLPGQMELADTDLDGDLDIVIANRGREFVAIYVNDGGATFTTAVIPAENLAQVQSAQVADLNGDAAPDIFAVASADDEIVVLLNEYENFFRKVIIQDIAFPILETVQTADMDGDGYQDLLVNSRGERKIAYLPYEPSSNDFGSEIVVSTNTLIRALLPIDYNMDGRLDLITVDDETGAGIFYRNIGNRFLEAGSIGSLGLLSDNNNISLGDLNGDNRTDLVVANPSGRILSYHIQQSDLRLEPPKEITTWARGEASIQLVAADEDPHPDLVICYEFEGRIELRYGAADNPFATADELIQLDNSIAAFELVDVDLDEDLDLLLISEDQLWLHHNNGDFSFMQSGVLLAPALDQLDRIQIVDANRDNLPDVVVYRQLDSDDPDGEVWVLANLAEAELDQPELLTDFTMPGEGGYRSEGAFLVDLGNDQDVDLIYYNQDATHLAWKENLDPTVVSTQEISFEGSFIAYPNPFSQQLQLIGDDDQLQKIAVVHVYNAQGQIVSSVPYKINRTLDLPTSLPAGHYILTCHALDGQQIATLPIVKQ